MDQETNFNQQSDQPQPIKADALKPKSNILSISLLTLIIGLVAGTLVGMYLLDPQSGELKTKEDQIATLKKELTDLKSKPLMADSGSNSLSDQDALMVKTINQTPGFDNIAPEITKIEGDWALTSPIPVVFDKNTGYSIPGMGGIEYVWHKVNGAWVFVAAASDSGYDASLVKDVPDSLIPASSRDTN